VKGRTITERVLMAAVALAFLLIGADALVSARIGPLLGIQLNVVATDFNTPVAGVFDPTTGLMLIAEHAGRVIAYDPADGSRQVVLDISDLVVEGFEQGLLGIAVHPRPGEDDRIFIDFSEAASGDQVIASVRRTADRSGLDPSSLQELLRIPQFNDIHKAGTLRFGPDGMLWVAVGDSGGDPSSLDPLLQDPLGHGQDAHTLPASILRIDIDSGDPYAIPPDNPFVDGREGAPEVWAFGLRNPWTMWFDHNLLVIGDVGYVTWEEINVLDVDSDAGVNLGWSMLEGPDCFAGRDCMSLAASPPDVALPRSRGACAVIVGPVYRGAAIPELVGELLYTDHCGPWLRSVPIGDPPNVAATTTWIEPLPDRYTAFIDGPGGEPYLLTWEGALLQIVAIRG
jgi:glucose/arabinose dehydrogenase